MATAGEVKVRITGDMRDLQVALNRAGQATERAAGNMERRWQALGATFARVGAIMGTAIAAGVALSVREAAGAEEIRSKFNAVFRGIEDDVRDWAETTAEATARSSIALEQYLSTFQDTFVPLGLARAEAAEFSQTLTQLAIDLASFNNESEPETVRALQSALVGNHETVRRYGVIINEAGLEQELLNMGIRGGREEATAAEAAMARLNIIMRGTVDAQGDAARTADSATNEWRAFTAELRDAAVAIGESFMPAARDLLAWARSVIPFLERIGTALGGIAGGISDRLGLAFSDSAEREMRLQVGRFEAMADAAGRRAQEALNRATRLPLGSDSRDEEFAEADRLLALQATHLERADELQQRIAQFRARSASSDTDVVRTGTEEVATLPTIAPAIEETQEVRRVFGGFAADIAPAASEMANLGEQIKIAMNEGKLGIPEVTDELDQMKRAMEAIEDGALKSLEDAFVDFVRTGRFEIANFVDYIIEQFARLTFQQYLEGPINSVLSSVIGSIGSAIGIPGIGASASAAAGQVRTSQAPVTNVYNIDARYATEGTADMISRAFQQNTPRIVRQSVDASVSSISQIQSSQRAV